MKILVDENVPLSVVRVLKRRGHEVARLADIQKEGITDDELIELAKKTRQVILTQDMDFGYVYYFSERDTLDVMVVKPNMPTPEAISKLLGAYFGKSVSSQGLTIIANTGIRVFRRGA